MKVNNSGCQNPLSSRAKQVLIIIEHCNECRFQPSMALQLLWRASPQRRSEWPQPLLRTGDVWLGGSSCPLRTAKTIARNMSQWKIGCIQARTTRRSSAGTGGRRAE
jgi:hypothetical protein